MDRSLGALCDRLGVCVLGRERPHRSVGFRDQRAWPLMSCALASLLTRVGLVRRAGRR